MDDKIAGFAHPELLWSVETLAQRMEDPNLILFDVRPSHRLLSGIIPGAVHMDMYGVGTTNTSTEVWSVWIDMMRSLFAMRGIGPDRSVCIYEHHQTGMLAARAFWLLEYLGHKDVHILNGGYQAWKNADQPIATEMAPAKPNSFPAKHQEQCFVSANTLNTMLKNKDLCVLDTRSDAEWYGQNKRGGPRGGTIPGSVHLEWTEAIDTDGTLLPASVLKSMFQEHGVELDKEIVPFCQGGYRSSHSYFVLRLLGYQRVRNFVGSWKEWGDRLDLPIEVPTTP